MTNHSSNQPQAADHLGSVKSYVIGFVTSIVLTLAAFYLVKNQVLDSTPLLVSILALAAIQMLVQMFFFLHLGRGPKPFYNIVFFAGTAGMIVLVVGASIFIMNSLYDHMSPEEATLRLAQDENIAAIGDKETGACQGNRANHEITIGTGVAVQHVHAERCDTLTIRSGDGMARELMFGTHDNPTSYGGHYELSLRSDRPKIITLNEIGDFSFHDSDNPALMGHFSVADNVGDSDEEDALEDSVDHDSHTNPARSDDPVHNHTIIHTEAH